MDRIEPDFSHIPTRTFPNGHDKGADLKKVERTLAHEWGCDVQSKTFESELVEKLITENSLVSLIGQPGDCKTHIALSLAIHIAIGEPWFGLNVTKGLAVYLALEGVNSLRKRVMAHRIHHKLTDKKFPFALIGEPLDLYSKTDDAALVIKKIRDLESESGVSARLIVVDTLNRSMPGGNENSAEDMSRLISNLEKIKKEIGATVMVVHHVGKDTTKGARGHSSLNGAVDTELLVSSGVIKAKKQRDLPTLESIGFRLEQVEIDRDADGKVKTSCVAASRQITFTDNSRKFTERALQAIEVLRQLVEVEGKAPPKDLKCHASKVILVDRWKQRFLDIHYAGQSKQARYQGFKRATTELFAANKVGTESVDERGYVWLITQ